MKRFNRIFTVIIFIFLYIPMIVLAVASFNKGTDVAVFKGFTFHQYAELFRDGTLLTLLRNSLFIAVLSSLSRRFWVRSPHSASTKCAARCARPS